MSLSRLLWQARLRHALAVAGLLLPWWGLTRLGWQRAHDGVPPALDVTALLLVALAALVLARRRDAAWLTRRLDARRPEFEDSAGLLRTAPANDLQALQRARLQARLAAVRPAMLALGPAPRPLLLNLAVAALLAGPLLLWPTRGDEAPPPAGASPTAPAAPVRVDAQLTITPPAYTALPAQQQGALDARVPEASHLHWQLQVEPAPGSIALRLHDGRELPLARDAHGRWHGEHVADAAFSYRLRIDGAIAADAAAHRIDVVADTAPRVRITQPAQTLTLIERADALQLVAEASDDHGLGEAVLLITHAHGDGENIEVSERRIALAPVTDPGSDTDPRRRVYRQRIDPAALGVAEGDDLILRVIVADNRRPHPQQAQSPAHILRWPRPAAAEAEGFEGLMQRTLPAYFRSQRQIIIDTEALVDQRPELDEDRFVDRSDAIGVDQRILRLRYGQFLGEEAEGGSTPPPSTAGDDDHHDHSHDDHDHHAHAHDHAPPGAAPADAARAIVDAYAHVHDHAEAATLFDPVTRELLRAALREMWQSELHLRQGAPAAALPYQYRALDHIKRVQQAGRIYLARVGLELPPIDFGRRLSGDRSGVRPRPDPLPDPAQEPHPAETLWHALTPPGDPARRAEALDRFADWLSSATSIDAPLPLYEAIEDLRLLPDCTPCAERLRARVAALRPVPAATPAVRPAADAVGRAYLDAVREAAP